MKLFTHSHVLTEETHHQHTLRARGFVSASGDGRPPFVRAPTGETCGIDFGALLTGDDSEDEYDPNEESEIDEGEEEDNSERKTSKVSLE